jgi:glycosyltransferase 2 family protein
MSTKKKLFFLLKAAIAFGAIYSLFRGGWLSTETFVHLCRWENIPVIATSCLFLACAQLLSVFRLILLLRTIHFPLRFFEGLKLNMIGLFFNTVLPGVLGGDLVKGYYLFKSEEAMKGKSIGILLMDRICGLLAIFFIGASAMFYLMIRQSRFLIPYRQETEVLLAGILFCFAVFGMLFILGRNAGIRSKIKQGATAILHGNILQNLISGFGALLQNGRIFACCLFISLTMQLLSLSGLLLLGRIVDGVLPDLIALTAVSSVVIVISVIPVTPGNLGWTELLAAFAWSAVGSDAGAEIFLYWRIVTVLCALPGGIFYLAHDTERKLGMERMGA